MISPRMYQKNKVRPIKTAKINFSVEKLSLCTASLQIFQLSGCLVDGSDRGSGEMSITKGSRGSVDMVGVSHDSGGNGLPDDGLSLDSDWDVDIVRGINMDGGWERPSSGSP